MSDLQISLLILGGVVIVAVVAYNRIQEARFRRHAEGAFSPDRGDALMDSGNAGNSTSERIEPMLQPEPDAHAMDHGGRQEPRTDTVSVSLGDETPEPIDYSAEVHASVPVSPDALQEMISALGALAPRVRIERRNAATGAWELLSPTVADAGTQVRVSLQLADRRGPVTATEVAAFQSAVARCAASLQASATIPEAEPFLARAHELDAFCAEVDVAVGINLIAPHDKPFIGTKLRGILQAAGFRLSEGGAFAFPDGHGGLRFTLENQEQPPFSTETLRSLATHGVTLLLDVPRLADGVRAFDEMVAVGKQLAVSLGGTLVDDNGIAVTAPGLEQIRTQLRGIYAAMEARGIPPGSPLALRLFA